MGVSGLIQESALGDFGLKTESDIHINEKELLAAFFGMKALVSENNMHVRLMIDNTTAVSYIREMGGSHSLKCNKIAREIQTWVKNRGLWLSSSYIQGS